MATNISTVNLNVVCGKILDHQIFSLYDLNVFLFRKKNENKTDKISCYEFIYNRNLKLERAMFSQVFHILFRLSHVKIYRKKNISFLM